MGENVKKQKKSGSINAFVIVFLVIVRLLHHVTVYQPGRI